MVESTLRIELAKPISIGKGDCPVTYDHLDLREPTAEEFAKATESATGFRQTMKLISLAAKVPESVIGQMPVGQVNEAGDFLMGFMERGRNTGET